MPIYVHHSRKGPDLVWDQGKIAGLLAQVRYVQGRLCGRMEGLGPSLREEARRQVQTDDAISFANARFAAMIHDAAHQYVTPLTKDRLITWHAELFPTAKKTPAQAKVHFQPSVNEGPEDGLNKLIHWVNSAQDTDPVIKAAVAQRWLVVIRPFEAGSERLGELVMESLLARANESGERFYSVAGQMRLDSPTSATSVNSPDITPWIEWYLGCMARAIKNSAETLGRILEKDRFWDRCAGMSLNDRQRTVLHKILDGQEDQLTSSKWATLTATSQDTAGRDINDLVRRGVLTKEAGGGRSTSYTLAKTH